MPKNAQARQARQFRAEIKKTVAGQNAIMRTTTREWGRGDEEWQGKRKASMHT
jgi:predicted hydrolase (HD superfamily)